MEAVTTLSQEVGLAASCQALGVPRSSYYRARAPHVPEASARSHWRALTAQEQLAIEQVLNSDRFCDKAPRQVYATLLDEGSYLCHWRTMYRVLAAHDQVRERRNQLRHPLYKKPELLARGPNELWSWDITKLRGQQKGTYYYLYVLMDVYSRYVVGWMVASKESSFLARELIETSYQRQGVSCDQLTIHSDRGSPMVSKTVAQLMADLGVEKSHSRPHVSNDNPYSEAHFKTMKYRGDYPNRFGSLEDARSWAHQFFSWYNQEHHHTGLCLLPPEVVHHGRAQEVLRARQAVLEQAYLSHPSRFVQGMPKMPELPCAVWINAPKSDPEPIVLPADVTGDVVTPSSTNLSWLLRCGDVVKPQGEAVNTLDTSLLVCPHLHDRQEARNERAEPH